MRNRSMFRWLIPFVAFAIAGCVLAADSRTVVPSRHIDGGLDGPPAVAENPVDGSRWAVWSYHHGREYDLAVSVLGPDGVWTEPSFLGLDDRRDQIDPSIVVDPRGNVHVAYVTADTDRVTLRTLPAGTSTWSAPVLVSQPGQTAGSPALRIVGDRLVIAFRTADGVEIVDRPLDAGAGFGTHGIQEGPDVVDPLGRVVRRDARSQPSDGGFGSSEEAENGDRRTVGPSAKAQDPSRK